MTLTHGLDAIAAANSDLSEKQSEWAAAAAVRISTLVESYDGDPVVIERRPDSTVTDNKMIWSLTRNGILVTVDYGCDTESKKPQYESGDPIMDSGRYRLGQSFLTNPEKWLQEKDFDSMTKLYEAVKHLLD